MKNVNVNVNVSENEIDNVYRIGIIGGGQLGKMLIQSFENIDCVNHQHKNIEIYVVDPCFDCPCAKIPFVLDANENNVPINFMQGSLYDCNVLREFCKYCDVVTYEIEHVNADELMKIRDETATIFYPSPDLLKTIQNKYSQNKMFETLGLPTLKFSLEHTWENCIKLSHNDKVVLKKVSGGYDGRGVKIIDINDNAQQQFEEFTRGESVLVEEYLDDKKEISVVVSRDQWGTVNTWPVVEMVFNEQHNILDYTFSPSNLPSEVQQTAIDIAKKAIVELDGVGIFAIEMFVDCKDHKVYINEIAPRPHNSGHHTIHSCKVSVYTALLDILVGTGNNVDQNDGEFKSAVMKNVLGTHDGLYELSLMMKDPNVFLVDYGKTLSKVQRKLGHITVVGIDKCNLLEKLKEVWSNFDIKHVRIPLVGIVMGSTSDWPTMKSACDILDDFGIQYEKLVVSAHRTPDRLHEYATSAYQRCVGVIIAGAGGAAHLPGMIASLTHIPVIGVPIKTSALSGVDSLYSIVQMPSGVPVATVAIGGGKNAGILAAQILSLVDIEISNKLKEYKRNLKTQVTFSANKLI